jgi:hypothetical protein
MENKAKFNTGRILITPNAQRSIYPVDVMASLSRHVQGDWGDVGKDDWNENEFSLDKYLRLFSVYHDRAGIKFWIITEADRGSTTILLPEDY